MELGSLIGFGQLGVYGLITYFYVRRYGSHLNETDKWTAIWFGFDGLCHLLFEGAYVLFTLFGTCKASEAYLALPWKEYAKADTRWAVYDPTVLSLELLTVLLAGPLAILLVWTILNNNKWRHPLQIIISVCELYGGWMTFGPEWVNGSPSINDSNFTYRWLYLIIPNGAWVVIPLYLLWLSIQAFFTALEGKRTSPKSPRAPKTSSAAPTSPATPAAERTTGTPATPTAPKSPRGRKPKAK